MLHPYLSQAGPNRSKFRHDARAKFRHGGGDGDVGAGSETATSGTSGGDVSHEEPAEDGPENDPSVVWEEFVSAQQGTADTRGSLVLTEFQRSLLEPVRDGSEETVIGFSGRILAGRVLCPSTMQACVQYYPDEVLHILIICMV